MTLTTHATPNPEVPMKFADIDSRRASSSRPSRLILAVASAASLLGTIDRHAAAQPLADRAAVGIAAPVRYDNHKLIRTLVRTPRDLMLLEQLSPDRWSHNPGVGGWVDYRVTPDALPALRQAEIPFLILEHDLQRVIDAEAARLAPQARDPRLGLHDDDGDGLASPRNWYADFKTPEQVSALADSLIATRPDLISRFNLGKSIENRDIWGLVLDGADAPPGVTKPTILLNSVQHAREWITVMTTMYIADQLVNTYGSDPRAASLLDEYRVVIVPVVNPDGYAYTWTNDRFWRKNRRLNANGSFGVDTNRNWGFAWGSNNGSSGNSSSQTYRGTAAFSEPETAAMRDWTLTQRGIVAHLDVHSYGQYLLYPWGYTIDPSPALNAFRFLSTGMQLAILDSGGVVYNPGPCYTTLYPVSGGCLDWYFGDRDALSWTPELRGNSFAPPPDVILPTAQEIYAAVLWLGENLCPIDLDRTGFLDTDDLDAFTRAFEQGSMKADVDFSGSVDTDDYAAFIAAYEEGC
jgi:murein tripeptide amidase MpaA